MIKKTAPIMLTINELSNETGISSYCIRTWIKEKKIKPVLAGTKNLINYDKFLDFLNGEDDWDS